MSGDGDDWSRLPIVQYDPQQTAAEKAAARALVISRAARHANQQRLQRLRRKKHPEEQQHSKKYISNSQPYGSTAVMNYGYQRGTLRVMEGNSDPFDSFAIGITPQVSRLMNFIRTEGIPQTYGMCMPAEEYHELHC
jgi:hypothetical protein